MNVCDKNIIVIAIISFLAGICQTTLAASNGEVQGKIGDIVQQGHLRVGYKSCFSYTIKTRVFYYCNQNSNGTFWFIQEFVAGENLTLRNIDEGNSTHKYLTTFPFAIDGRQYYFGLAHDNYRWFIAELLEGGKMGQVTDSGTWKKAYETCFPFETDMSQYFFCQNKDAEWFIQELLPGGKMGTVMSFEKGKNYYSTAILFKFPSTQYVYFYDKVSGNWYNQELFSTGEITDHGRWASKYQVCCSYTMAKKMFYLCLSTKADENYYYIQEVTSDGKMGTTWSTGNLEEEFDNLFTFTVDGKQYFFASSSETYNYRIQKLI